MDLLVQGLLHRILPLPPSPIVAVAIAVGGLAVVVETGTVLGDAPFMMTVATRDFLPAADPKRVAGVGATVMTVITTDFQKET